jgi:hypothetical protein
MLPISAALVLEGSIKPSSSSLLDLDSLSSPRTTSGVSNNAGFGDDRREPRGPSPLPARLVNNAG